MQVCVCGVCVCVCVRVERVEALRVIAFITLESVCSQFKS